MTVVSNLSAFIEGPRRTRVDGSACFGGIRAASRCPSHELPGRDFQGPTPRHDAAIVTGVG
jgi:hypothetical protein